MANLLDGVTELDQVPVRIDPWFEQKYACLPRLIVKEARRVAKEKWHVSWVAAERDARKGRANDSIEHTTLLLVFHRCCFDVGNLYREEYVIEIDDDPTKDVVHLRPVESKKNQLIE